MDDEGLTRMIRRTYNTKPSRKRCPGNLKPAPFGITPGIVARVLDVADRPAARVAEVPVLPIQLVDQPRASEQQLRLPVYPVPHCAGQPSSAPSTSTGTAPRSEEAQPAARVDSRSGPVQEQREQQGDGRPKKPSASKPTPVEPVQAAESVPVDPDQVDWPDAPLPNTTERGHDTGFLDAAGAKDAAKRLATYRRAKDQATIGIRSKNFVVDMTGQGRKERPRIELIRVAATKLREQAATTKGRLRLGTPTHATPQIPALLVEQRRARLERAIAFLRRNGVLVSVLDREAQIRRYRVSGKAESKLAEDVIQIAIERGMPA